MQFKNIPPKQVQNAIWSSCFDYEDFDTVIDGMTVRERVYQCWQLVQYVLQSNPNYIANGTPDIPELGDHDAN